MKHLRSVNTKAKRVARAADPRHDVVALQGPPPPPRTFRSVVHLFSLPVGRLTITVARPGFARRWSAIYSIAMRAASGPPRFQISLTTRRTGPPTALPR